MRRERPKGARHCHGPSRAFNAWLFPTGPDPARPGGAAGPAYWNLHVLDHARRGVFFRVSDNGQPVIRGTYADKGGHSISGYHVDELAFLAQVYQRAFLPRDKHQHTGLTLHFIPSAIAGFVRSTCCLISSAQASSRSPSCWWMGWPAIANPSMVLPAAPWPAAPWPAAR